MEPCRPDMSETDAETLRRAGRIFADNRPVFALSGDGIARVPEGLVPGVEADLSTSARAAIRPAAARRRFRCARTPAARIWVLSPRNIWPGPPAEGECPAAMSVIRRGADLTRLARSPFVGQKYPGGN